MKSSQKKPHFFSKESLTFLLLTAISLIILIRYVDIAPHVDQDFFFSSEDPGIRANNKISKLFARSDAQLILGAQGDIFSPEYSEKMRQLCDLLLSLDMVHGVKSITHGPDSLRKAMKSPFWKRLLISKDEQATNIIVLISEPAIKDLIPKVEDLVSALESEDFQIKISGFPYIVELIRRNLTRDLNVFSSAAFVLFGIVVILVFHSWRVLLGMLVTCVNACTLTLIINHLLDIKIGVLTANLITIIFVLTLSHIVFLTFNWKNLHQLDEPSVDQAVRMTRSASFWSMFTTLLGFLSLLFVPAKPLRELGLSGSIGTLTAFIITYSIYPSFLRLKEKSHLRSDRRIRHYYHGLFAFLDKYRNYIIAIILTFIIVTFASLKYLDTDPSLISYFAKNSKITKGLEYIDRNGGSSPLLIVLKTKTGEPLNTNKSYRQLWKLQEDLENYKDIGTVLALPTLMAESKRSPFAIFFSREKLLRILERPKYGKIAKSFITKDRQRGVFLLRMNELDRKKHRLQVIKEIQTIIYSNGFIPHLTGGIYALQGRLARLVADSLIFGLARLIILFMIIALIVSRSFRISLSMTGSIIIIPLCILGAAGFFGIPLDIISAPASNVAIAMGIDAMLHMTFAFRRLKDKSESNAKKWAEVRKQMWEPIITAMFTVSTGFGIFFFSSFPPTQRFGGAIVWGTIIAAMTALFIFPLLSTTKNTHEKTLPPSGIIQS